MANLSPSLIPLDKGLNLQTPKLVAPAGSVLDTLNYEQVDFQGQKRIDGFTRYDGNMLSVLDEYYKITLTDSYAGAVGDLLAAEDGLLGVAVGSSGSVVYLAVINETLIPEVGDTLYTLVDGANTNGNVVTAIVTGTESGVTVDQHYTNLLSFTSILRSRVGGLPGAIIGLHWFRDRLYAVADVLAISIDGTTPVLYPNDVIAISSQTAKVLHSITNDNTRTVFINTLTPDDWLVEGTAVTRNASSVGSVANGFQALPNVSEVASFFESRTEAQVLEEDGPTGPYDFGWRFVDQGWSVPFEDGLSLYGSLPSLNQNIIGIGVQGPSSIADNNGRPLILSQKSSISDKAVQVAGWKSSQTPNSYELETDNLIATDTDTIYADAYISWDGVTGEVSALTDTLVEYPATNTIELTA